MASIAWAAEFDVLARRYSGRVAVDDARGEVAYAALFAKAAGIAKVLSEARVGSGHVVATSFRNDRNAVAAMLAVMMTGAAEVPLNPALGEADRDHCCRIADARLILTSSELAPRFDGLGEVIVVDDIPTTALRADEHPSVEDEAAARIVFTSGTTGMPKGAMHTQRARWTANLLLRASLPERPDSERRVLLMTPFSHGTSLMTLAYLSSGGTVTLRDGVDTDVILPLLESGSVGAMFAPPTVLAKIVDAAGERRISTLRTIFCGTAVLKPTLYARAKAIFGPIIRVTYGKSEVFNPITVLEADETDAWYRTGEEADACVGWPAAGVELSVRDESGREVPRGETGEVLIRARHLMAGYHTANGFVPLGADGFHDTGDLGYLDAEGRLHLTGRMAEVIKSGGYKITPEEVERELGPAIQPCEVAVFGIPSDYWGDIVVAAVEHPPPGWEERLDPVLAKMTSYKRPRLLIAFDHLPRNGIGKIMRGAIRRDVLSRYRVTDGSVPALEPREDAPPPSPR